MEELSSSDPNNIISLLSSPVGFVLNTDIIIVESDKSAEEASKLMKDRNARCVLASHKGEVVGIVSKTDILFKVLSQDRNPAKVKLREIMTSPVLAIDPKTTVKEALSIMDKHLVRQVMVHAYSAVLGMVTRERIYQKLETISLSSEDTALQGTPVCLIDTKSIAYMKDPNLANLKCPYCESPFDTKEGLSKHIDRLHGGAGVLEGDVRRMFE
ncbi:MAG: CBS domain-containing protein [Nitrososphaeraceae archaeon]|nr:CBS domain-containing protein [Nitrososphaeraceae archaeon]MBV9667656.1 CBS domain-containing protein [Nitrososphaeraceae archaeon]